MNDVTPEANKPWEAEAENGSFGAWLRRQREVREISLREIAETSKISIRYLEALEQDRFEVLPAALFAKGFLREYAKFVGLDPDEVVNYYLSARPDEEQEERANATEDSQQVRRISPVAIAGVVLFAVALGAALWFLSYRAERVIDEVPAIAPPPSTAAPAAPASEPPAAPLDVALDFHQKGWVEAFVDGERTVSEFRVQGESLRLSAQREIRLSLGNPTGVTIEVNGRPYEVQLAEGRDVVIDLSTIADEGSEAPR